jgi:hypothetical protein
MFHRWAALLLVLAFCAMTPKNAAGQTQTPRGQSAGSIGRNFPNPFNPSTSIRFAVDTVGGCDGSRQHVVTLRVVNTLSRPIAHFVVLSDPNSTTSVSSSLSGPRVLNNLRLGCGVYVGFWDGNLPNGKEAASGVYLAQLYIDGKLQGGQRMLK